MLLICLIKTDHLIYRQAESVGSSLIDLNRAVAQALCLVIPLLTGA